VVLVVAAVVLPVISAVLNINIVVAGVLAAMVVAVVTGTIWPLVVVLWFGCACYVVGGAILSVFKIAKERVTGLATALVGAGVYGTAVGIAAHFPINYPGLYGVALAAPVVWGWRDIGAAIRSLGPLCGDKSSLKWHDLAIACMALVYFVVALMPEVGHDALAMHLFIPAHLAARHQWGYDVSTYVWAVMPMMGDWLFSIVYMLGGEVAARLLNLGFILVLSWLVRDLVLWAGGSALGVRWAVLLFLATPLTFLESSSLFIESVWAAFVVAGSIAVFKLLAPNQPQADQAAQLKLAGFLLGLAAAAKAVTFTILPALLILLLWHGRSWGQRKLLGAIVLGAVLLIAIGVIPYATAWYITGNPMFPFFNAIFQSPFYPSVNFEPPSVFGKGLTWDALYQATFHTGSFLEGGPGAPGFQWMLLFIPAFLVLAFARQRKAVMLVAVAVVSIALLFQSITYLRYILPSFVWVAAGIGVALSALQPNRLLAKVFPMVCGLVIALNLVFFKAATYYGDLFLQPLMSASGRAAYLNNRLPIRNAVELVNHLNTGGAPVAVFAPSLTAGLKADGLYPSWYNHQFEAQVQQAATADQLAQLLIDKGVTYVILDSDWGNAGKRALIENATLKISEQGSITVRKLNAHYQFQSELLKNPDFASYDSWQLPPEMLAQSSGSMAVSVSSAASQLVSVVAGRSYLNAVTASCKDQPTKGRVQVNWLDARSKFIGSDIKIFDCTPTSTTYTMEVTAPPNASTAVVYATGHTSSPIVVSGVSFKK
jgi:4-amino-4-deoxy-L-arabinose transferase-like glycosyltransferase